MPTYSYLCESCAHVTELWTSMKTKPDFVNCEKCQAPAKSQLGVSNFIVNGYSAANRYTRTNKDRRK